MHFFSKYKLPFILSCILYIYLFIINKNLLSYPPIWPDESLFADIAQNILKDGRLGPDLLIGYVDNIEKHGFGYPPLYMYLTAIWFKFFGLGILNYRIMSVMFSLGVLIMTYIYSLKVTLSKSKYAQYWALIPVILLMSSSDFIRASIIARPEIVVIFFGLLAIYSHELALVKKETNNWGIYNIWLSVLFSTISTLIHWPGLAFAIPIGISSLANFRGRELKHFALACVVSLFLYMSIWPLYSPILWEHFQTFMQLRFEYNETNVMWFLVVLSNPSGSHRYSYALYFFLSLLILFQPIRWGRLMRPLLLISTWFFAYLWKQEYTFSLTIVCIILQIPHLIPDVINHPIESFKSKKNLQLTVITACIIILYTNVSHSNYLAKTYGKESYANYAKKVLDNIPDDNSTVYLGSIPDTYFAFIEMNRKNRLHHYPPVPIRPEKKEILYSFDYYVLNSYEPSSVTNPFAYDLNDYLYKNGEVIKEYPPSETNPYGLVIIKITKHH